MRNPKILTRTLAKTKAKPVATVPTDDVSPGQPIAGLLAQQHITVLLVGIGLRFTRSASAYYRAAFDLGMAEWRLLHGAQEHRSPQCRRIVRRRRSG